MIVDRIVCISESSLKFFTVSIQRLATNRAYRLVSCGHIGKGVSSAWGKVRWAPEAKRALPVRLLQRFQLPVLEASESPSSLRIRTVLVLAHPPSEHTLTTNFLEFANIIILINSKIRLLR